MSNPRMGGTTAIGAYTNVASEPEPVEADRKGVIATFGKAGDAGKPYPLARAFSYTNGIKFLNGEYLDLTFDVLLFITANNVLPTVFENFGGLLDQDDEATAAVKIPAALPPGLEVPIFVSGVVIDPQAPGGVSTVGDTRWFTLR